MKGLVVTDLMSLPHFVSLHCEGNMRLFSPPPEISVQGGKATMAYLREAALSGETKTLDSLQRGDGGSWYT
jgi:hypothetical protein